MPSIGQNPSQTTGQPSSRHALRSRPAQPIAPSGGLIKTPEGSVYKGLMALAARPAYGVTLALAGTISHSWHTRGVRYLPLFGLDAETTYRLLSSHFPGIGRMMGVAWGDLLLPRIFEEAFALSDLVDLLDQNRTVVDEDGTWLAHAVATSCLGEEALWRDMNLASAAVLQDLLHDFFTTLSARNRCDMPWKDFLLQELTQRAAHRQLRMPVTSPLPDYASCFGR
ncbi:nitrogen fixation protein NifQ [Uliginosibacterium sp. H3]|uniref:Nitrogen fixation protein NifQ n=1 Tax=Uliginosibacterium silvisoli TaxID=3114758 RepID=A0ABU6K5Y4_9RHOO|nr:nitrogen fixation protein NifQ [Uliginosibacterium sp. H3]